MKKIFLLLLGVMMVLLVACGKDNESNSNTTGDATDENVELTFTIWGGEAHIEMYEELLEEFYVENPNIKVNIETIPHGDYQQKLSVLAGGNDLPDIGWVAERMVPQFVKNNILADITDVVQEEEFDFDDYIPSTLELWEHGDQLLGLPFSTPPMIMYYNKTMFDEAGLETPIELSKKDEWTWDKFEETAKELSRGSGGDRTYGARLFDEWTNFATIPSHTISYGGSLFSEENGFEWNSPEGVESFEMLNRMMFEDKSHVYPGENLNFESGKIGMFTFMYSYIGNLRGITDFEWDIAPLPSGPNGRAPLLGMAGVSVFEGGDHMEEAKKLLAFLGSKQGIQAQSQFFVPPRKSVLESDEFINVPNNPPKESIEIAVINEMNNGYLYPLHEDWPKIESEIISGFDNLFAQIGTPAEILEEMDKKIKEITDK